MDLSGLDSGTIAMLSAGLGALGGGVATGAKLLARTLKGISDDAMKRFDQVVRDANARADRMEAEVVAALRAVSNQRDDMIDKLLRKDDR